MKKAYTVALGLVTGLFNGLFGSGGGVVAVPLLQKAGLKPKEAHATSIAVIFVLSALSTVLYFMRGGIQLSQALPYLPGGLVGAVVGALLLKKIPNTLLRRIFGVILLASAVKLLWQNF